MPVTQSWFNSDLWKNHYARTQRLGAGPQAKPPLPTPGSVVTPPASVTPPATPAPTLDLSGVGNAGQKAVAGPMTTPPAPSMVMPGQAQTTPPATPGAAVPPVPAATPATPAGPATGSVSNPGPYQGLEGDVLKQLASGVNGKAALPGTEAAMRRNRETLAQYAGGMERQAGARATKAGAIGQGTAATLGDDTKSDVLSKLAENAQNEEQIVSNEKQGLIDKATQAVQANQNLQQNREQFNANMAQRKVEFDKTFGSQESQQYLNQLERMAQDNPVLAEKLSNYLMGGKTGPVGEFTVEEKAKLAEYVKKKEVSQGKLDEVMGKILEGLPAQVAAGQQSSTDAAAAAGYAKTLSQLKPGEILPEADFQKMVAVGAIKSYNAGGIPKGQAGAETVLKDNPSGIINLQGQQFKVARGGKYGQSGVEFIELVDPATGKHYWHDELGKWYDKLPHGQTPNNMNKPIPSPLKGA